MEELNRKKYEETEKLLKQMPQVKDERSKDLIYQNIKARLKEQKPVRKNKPWLLSSIASAAAIIIFVLLIPSIFENNEDIAMFSNEESTDRVGVFDTEKSLTAEESTMEMAVTFAGGYVRAIKEEDKLDSQLIIPQALIDANARFVVPINVIAEGSHIDAEFQNLNITNISGEYGLGNSLLDSISFYPSMKEEATVVINVPSNRVPVTSSESIMLRQSLESVVATLGYNKMEFMTDGQPGIEFGNYGRLMEIEIASKTQGYFIHQSISGHRFLVPGTFILGENEFMNFRDTIGKMKIGDVESGFEASIPEEIVIEDIVENKAIVTIVFAEGTSLDFSDQSLEMVEAILLTARDFGFEYVIFENTGTEMLGMYSLADPISVNIYPNVIYSPS